MTRTRRATRTKRGKHSEACRKRGDRGGCPWCESNRLHAVRRDMQVTREDRDDDKS
jgi:hypothetical protein